MESTQRRTRYVLKRLFQAIPIVLAIVVLNFFLLQLAEGDAVDVLAGEAGSATPEYMAELREKFGLDKPLIVQLGVYLKNVLTLDLGYSFRHDMPVSELVFDRFIPWTRNFNTLPLENGLERQTNFSAKNHDCTDPSRTSC